MRYQPLGPPPGLSGAAKKFWERELRELRALGADGPGERLLLASACRSLDACLRTAYDDAGKPWEEAYRSWRASIAIIARLKRWAREDAREAAKAARLGNSSKLDRLLRRSKKEGDYE